MTVPNEAIDDLGHVNNVIYLEWVQEVSTKHWTSRVSQNLRDEVFWVVLNHNIDYKNPAFEGDKLVLKTWVEKIGGVKSERHVEISRPKDNKVIVKAKTIWCLVDLEKQRPKRITSEISTVFVKEEN